MFRDERDILLAIAVLLNRVSALEQAHATLQARVKTLEDRAGGVDTTVHSKLDLLLHQQALLLQQGGTLMATAQELSALLDTVDTTTTAMATQLAAQLPVLQEIDADIDALLTRGTEPIPQALLDRFTLHRDRLQGLSTTISDTSTKLEATAAKSPAPDPTPTPVPTEPPVELPPTEEPATPA